VSQAVSRRLRERGACFDLTLLLFVLNILATGQVSLQLELNSVITNDGD
jgi:hypothetical protein